MPAVALDGRATVRRETGGVERYATEVTDRLCRMRPDRYRMLAPPPRLAHRAGHLWEQAVLPWRARHCRLLLCPANLSPLVGPATVVVIHDVAALSQPSAYSRGYVAYQRLMLPAIARRARRVITVSEFSRREIVERLDVSFERVVVVPGGVSDHFATGADAAEARRVLGLAGDYVLAVSTESARKNHGVLRGAAAALHARGAELVLAGSDRGYLRSAETSDLRRLGYVPEEHLPGLYAGARAFVMPSRYEGFGLPCLEAMASGTPVVAARAGALPETCGDAALLVDPEDPDGFTDAILAAASDEALRRRLIAAGRARAASFTWERTVERLDAELGRILTR